MIIYLIGKKDKESSARIMFLEFHIADEIAKKRLLMLSQFEKGKRCAPYDSEELSMYTN